MMPPGCSQPIHRSQEKKLPRGWLTSNSPWTQVGQMLGIHHHHRRYHNPTPVIVKTWHASNLWRGL